MLKVRKSIKQKGIKKKTSLYPNPQRLSFSVVFPSFAAMRVSREKG